MIFSIILVTPEVYYFQIKSVRTGLVDVKEISLRRKKLILLPVYKFSIETGYTPQEIKCKIESVIKDRSEVKGKVYTSLEGIGKEEFQGSVTEEKFKLIRFKYDSFSNNSFLLYKGTYEKMNKGTIVNFTFTYLKFIFFVIIVLFYVCTSATIDFINGQIEGIDQLVAALLIPLLIIGIHLVGFNYRIKKARKYFERLLR